MKSLSLFFAVGFGVSCVAAAAPFEGKVVRLEPEMDRLIDASAQIEKIAEGYDWAEGPVWFEGHLLFSDVPANVVYRWRDGMDAPEVFLKPSGLLTPQPGFREPGSNGLARDNRGRLLLCQHGERRVARLEGKEFVVLADRFEGKRFNSPNDLAVRRNGDVYFTDPPYGLEGGGRSPLRELDFSGVYKVSEDGVVMLLTRSLETPNGLAFSPDEKTLYVAVNNQGGSRIVAFDVRDDGTIENERVLFDVAPLRAQGLRGGCDGLKVDREGNIWATGPGGVLILSPAGKLLGRIHTGVGTANCAWAEDGSVLYITADMFLLRVPTRTIGADWR